MNEQSSKAESDQDEAVFDLGRVHLLVEVIAVVALIGILLWLVQNVHPQGLFESAILNYRIWILVLAVSAGGAAGGLVPYYVGQRGTEAVLKHYPSLKGRRWDRLETLFRRWGVPTLILSGIPALGTALMVVAGAMGIKRWGFLVWTFLGKVLRNWVLAFAFLLGLQIVR